MGQLINTSDVSIRHLTAGVPSERFDPFIIEAEEYDIKLFLGDALYLDFINNKGDTKYTNLLNGAEYTSGSYTLKFRGLKTAIEYYAYARYLANHDITHSKVGVSIPKNDYSERPSEKSIQRKIDNARSLALQTLEDAKNFLNTESSTYPLWANKSTKGQGGFKMTVL